MLSPLTGPAMTRGGASAALSRVSKSQVPAKAGMDFPVLEKNAAKTKESSASVQTEATAGVW
jgi:hypothetical protein